MEEAYSQQGRVWVSPITGQREDDVQAQARMILNEMMKLSLKHYPSYYEQEVDGDNYCIVRNVLKKGTSNSMEMVHELRAKLESWKKTKDMPYPKYEKELRETFSQLEMLGETVTDMNKVFSLVNGMKGDYRYKHDVREALKSALSYERADGLFQLTAKRIDDMHPIKKKKDNSLNNVEQGSKGGGKRRGKGGKNQNKDGDRNKSDDQPKGGGNERKDKSQNKKKRVSPCIAFLIGNCTYGDKCKYTHVSYE